MPSSPRSTRTRTGTPCARSPGRSEPAKRSVVPRRPRRRRRPTCSRRSARASRRPAVAAARGPICRIFRRRSSTSARARRRFPAARRCRRTSSSRRWGTRLPEQKLLSLVPDVEQELDRLHALPLEGFTPARNDLARRLTKAGRADAAGEVKKLAKPSVPVWTANQLARREPGELRALLRSAEELRKAQQQALAGKSGASDLQERLAEQRRATRALARLGRDILADEGRSVSDAIVERIAKTVDPAALDEGARVQLRAGRLTEELDPARFQE